MAYWTVLAGGANLALSIYLGRRYGILGVAFGTTIPMLVVKLIVQPWYVLRVAGVTITDYLATVVGPLASTGCCIAVVKMIPTGTPSFLTLALNVLWQSALFGASAFFFVLTPGDRKLVLSAARYSSTLLR
jgi:hypothetical protein